MIEPQLTRPANSGLDTVIKVLTIIKLLIEIALWGVMLGGTIYLIQNNPLPKIITQIQQQALSGFLPPAGK